MPLSSLRLPEEPPKPTVSYLGLPWGNNIRPKVKMSAFLVQEISVADISNKLKPHFILVKRLQPIRKEARIMWDQKAGGWPLCMAWWSARLCPHPAGVQFGAGKWGRIDRVPSKWPVIVALPVPTSRRGMHSPPGSIAHCNGSTLSYMGLFWVCQFTGDLGRQERKQAEVFFSGSIAFMLSAIMKTWGGDKWRSG